MEIKRATEHKQKTRWLAEHEAYLEATYSGTRVAVSDAAFAGAGVSREDVDSEAFTLEVTDSVLVGVKSKD